MQNLTKLIWVALASLLSCAASAANLADGIKGLKLGVPQSTVFEILEKQYQERGGSFRPHCSYDKAADSEDCWAIGAPVTPITYGNIPISWISVEFAKGRLEAVNLEIASPGCVNNKLVDQTPEYQFGVLGTLMRKHYGRPDVAKADELVWVENGRALDLALRPPPEGQPLATCRDLGVTFLTSTKALARAKAKRYQDAIKNDL